MDFDLAQQELSSFITHHNTISARPPEHTAEAVFRVGEIGGGRAEHKRWWGHSGREARICLEDRASTGAIATCWDDDGACGQTGEPCKPGRGSNLVPQVRVDSIHRCKPARLELLNDGSQAGITRAVHWPANRVTQLPLNSIVQKADDVRWIQLTASELSRPKKQGVYLCKISLGLFIRRLLDSDVSLASIGALF